ncbi:MAG: hypothetical protein KTR32_13885, partial [Granulosicoccus sp.]|nr:hypothetical protein [Granulosicoccus sp.]
MQKTSDSARAQALAEKQLPAEDFNTLHSEIAPVKWPLLGMLWRDKLAFIAAIFLFVVVCAACFGPWLLEELATKNNLRGRNAEPFDFSRPWVFWLGGEALGRPLLARILVAAQNTMMVAA